MGQVAQLRIKLRLLKQEGGGFTFQEQLKAVVVLDTEISVVRDGLLRLTVDTDRLLITTLGNCEEPC